MARASTSTTPIPSTRRPETTNPRDCVIWDKAGERILNLARSRAEAVSPPEQRIIIHKNNTDRRATRTAPTRTT